jgi:transcriptional regulator with XRE-family HTH domain
MIHYTPFCNNVKGFVTTDINYCCIIGNMTFIQWLEIELEKRHWRRSDLARAAGLTDTAITLVWNGQRKPGYKMCRGIAKALNISEETVVHHAGLLTIKPESDLDFEEMKHLFLQMSKDEQEVFLEQGRAIISVRIRRKSNEKGQQSELQINRTAHVMESDEYN